MITPASESASGYQRADVAVWSQHWSEGRQRTFAQRIFSIYRRVVISRVVQYFCNRYFPRQGIFVEAGSGTSETSLRIDKRGGARRLIALDILPSVLAQCEPVMDFRLNGDVFHLPFGIESIDGIWNVGVMEHFTHQEIEQILGEFFRVVRHGGHLILLWPATDSLPQKLLRFIAQAASRLRRGARVEFHPPEISQLRSSQEGRQVLLRHGFAVQQVTGRLSSLLGFKILVGRK